MGSGNKRKQNDNVRINVPVSKTAATNNRGMGSGGTGDDAIDINQACPLAFRVRVNQQLQSGLKVTLIANEMQVGGETIGKLPDARRQQMIFCTGQGIEYAGKIENEDGTTFVRFEQLR